MRRRRRIRIVIELYGATKLLLPPWIRAQRDILRSVVAIYRNVWRRP
jgi:hypothetical protein